MSNFEEDPIETIRQLGQGLRIAKARYRYFYKQIMMSIIAHDLNPTRNEKFMHEIKVIGADLGAILAAIFKPTNYEYSLKYAEATRGELDLAIQSILDDSSWIIDRLSQKERLEYLYEVFGLGITEANKKWRDNIYGRMSKYSL